MKGEVQFSVIVRLKASACQAQNFFLIDFYFAKTCLTMPVKNNSNKSYSLHVYIIDYCIIK